MNIQELFTIQQKLNDRIMSEHQLVEHNLFQEQLLAFLVEVSELANETRCFKYWSRKGASEKAIILEEYVDGVHFLLTIGLALKFTDVEIDSFEQMERSLTVQFLDVMALTHRLQETRELDTYKQLFLTYFSLGEALGFSPEEVEEAYLAKNKVNHKRQDEGY
ncbi:dUTP diphosphatase [Bacillus sp. JCM 19034]|uniref:dUTP diphosphatase n=1 Tax=Bacillus sp. JCM 19034 TaxID=1481928 RepID=UPI0007834146|nr:dUTP diphosphatase [Bacillus sp. JCM 19034]